MYRLVNFLIILLVIAAMSFAIFYLEGVLHLDPCPLCIIDRMLLVLIGCVSTVALLHNSRGAWRRVTTILAGVFGLLGIAVSARHIWLQNLPPDKVPECGPDLAYMLEVLPLADVIKSVFTGSGQCADIDWMMLGLTIPQQTLFLFIFLFFLVLIAHRAK